MDHYWLDAARRDGQEREKSRRLPRAKRKRIRRPGKQEDKLRMWATLLLLLQGQECQRMMMMVDTKAIAIISEIQFLQMRTGGEKL